MKTRLIGVVIPAVAALAIAAPAGAATSGTSSEAVSENWAGYEATTTNSDGFSAVSGSWVQPTVTATDGTSYSAYWVGLGGGDANSDALEQDGTQGDVSANGTVTYYAWYELVPDAPVKVPVTVHAGDQIYARTVVNGDRVTFTIDNKTTGQDWTKTVTMTDATPDTSTAEWVAEAPSACEGSTDSSCEVLNLADFGKVNFTDAHARSDGQVKSISGWNSEAIELSPSAESSYGYGGGYGGGFGASDTSTTSTGNSEGAAPGDLSSNGTAFTVTYGAQDSSATSTGVGSTSTAGAGAGSAYGASGYGDSGYGDSGYGDSGYGYGDSGYGDSGYGYGYGDSGYGDSGYGASSYGDSGYGDSSYGYTSGYDDAGGYGSYGGGYDGGDSYINAGQQAVLNALKEYAESYYGTSSSASAVSGY